MADGKISDIDPRLKDWRWRINNLYTIVNKDSERVLFRENGIQKAINDCRKRRKMVLKYRQGGVTTGEAKKQLDFVAFGMNKNACIMADDEDNMKKVFAKVLDLYHNMHPKFKPRLDRGGGSQYELRFPDINGRIYCSIEGRGDTIHWLHVSEAAHAEHSRIKATLEAVPLKRGIVTFESTPNGMGNHFYRRWIEPSIQMEKLFFPWFYDHLNVADGSGLRLTSDEIEFAKAVKGRYGIELSLDQFAYRRIKQEDQKELFPQEYPEDDISCFLASGAAAMDLMLVKKLLDKVPDPIEDTGQLKIWKKYDSSRVYACGTDTAEGVGGDYSVADIFDVKTREQVAQFRSKSLRPRAFAHEVYNLCQKYNKPGRAWPLLGVECNNHGHAVLLELDEHLGYPNLYKYKEDRIGWKTDSITRPMMIDAFIDGVENGTAVLNSRETLGECLTLIDNDGKIEAEDGENDDTIISASIGIQMCIEASGNLSVYDDIKDKILL